MARKASTTQAWSFPSMKWLFSLIEGLSRRQAVWFMILTISVGQLLNHFRPMALFGVYQLLFIPAIVIAFQEIQKFLSSIREFEKLTASHPNREVGSYIRKLINSNWAIGGVLLIGSIFLYASLRLQYINLDIMGLYALFVIALIMISAVLGQTCYIYYLLLLRRIASGEKFKYNFYFPAKTDWVLLLSRMGARLNNAFFFLGFIYTLVFYLNMPSHYVVISLQTWQLRITTPDNFIFTASWAAIFLIIIVAFPVYYWTSSALMRRIVERLKTVSVNEVELLMESREGGLRGNVDIELKYYQLIANIQGSLNEPQKDLRLLPALATFGSIAVHGIKIFESLAP